MAQHHLTGKKGESLAVINLEEKGYQILETNWRFSRAEVDIIAKDGDILVFVEVKTRSNSRNGEPELSVTERKQALLADAASVYMEQIQHDWEIRFDIISIILPHGYPPEITHYKDAFFP